MPKKIRNFLKKHFPWLVALRRKFFESIHAFYLNKVAKKQTEENNNIKVVFICQCQHIWDKMRPIVLDMLTRKSFCVFLLIIPEFEMKKKDAHNSVFVEQATQNATLVFYKKGIKNQLKAKPDYVFYSRPYDNYLPKKIRINQVHKYSKTLLLSYACNLMDLKSVPVAFPFFKYLYMYFADDKSSQNQFISLHLSPKTHFGFNEGYPYFEEIINGKADKGESAFKKFKKGPIKVIWTPRWTTEPHLGGSNLLTYMDSMFDYFINNPKYIFVFRPHPYAFPNFIEKGLISNKQFEIIKNRFAQSSNSMFDSSRLYLDTLFDADIMITDISSIIAEFFYTGKPIIFCHNKPPETISSEMRLILSCDYNAYSFDDIILEVEKLSKGLDEYKHKRKQISSNFFANSKGSTKRINDIIENDYKRKAQ